MRRQVAAVVLLVAVLASPVLGQEKQILLGIKGGVNLANVSVDPEPAGSRSQDRGVRNLQGAGTGAGDQKVGGDALAGVAVDDAPEVVGCRCHRTDRHSPLPQ